MTLLRTITGTVNDTGAGVLTFRLTTAIISNGVVVPAQIIDVPYADNAPFSTAVPVPDSGTAQYLIRFPNNEIYTVYLANGGPVDLSTLVSIAGFPIPDTAGVVTAAIAAHAALTSGTHGITAAGAALTTAADADAQRTALGLAALFAPGTQPIRAGNLYGVPNVSGQVITTRALIANRIYYQPFAIDRAITVTALRCEVQTAVLSTLIRFGICRIGTDGQPTASGLIVDAGEVDSGSPGVKTITGLSATLTPGAYAVAITSNGAPTLRGARGGSSLWFGDSWGVNGLVATMRTTRTYAPLADPLPAWDVNDGTGNGMEYTAALLWSIV